MPTVAEEVSTCSRLLDNVGNVLFDACEEVLPDSKFRLLTGEPSACSPEPILQGAGNALTKAPAVPLGSSSAYKRELAEL